MMPMGLLGMTQDFLIEATIIVNTEGSGGRG